MLNLSHSNVLNLGFARCERVVTDDVILKIVSLGGEGIGLLTLHDTHCVFTALIACGRILVVVVLNSDDGILHRGIVAEAEHLARKDRRHILLGHADIESLLLVGSELHRLC